MAKHLTGLQRILKMYGTTTVKGDDKTVVWFWDYANDEPVREADMPRGSERWQASEKARLKLIAS